MQDQDIMFWIAHFARHDETVNRACVGTKKRKGTIYEQSSISYLLVVVAASQGGIVAQPLAGLLQK